MTAIFVNSFQGERPRIDPRHLPNEFAQTAKGCHFYHGNLSPLRQLADAGSSVIFDAKTIFRYLNEHWFAWNVDVDAVNSPIANDPWQRVYYTGDSYPKVTNNAIFSGNNMPVASYRLGVQAPEVPISGVVTESPTDEIDPNDDEDRYYTHTFVTGQGEEGPPGEASAKIVLLYPNEPGTFVTLALLPPESNQSNITSRRIYRTSTGGGTADYLFVAELPISQSEFIDNMEDAELGAALETYDYERPPEDMFGLVSMANGILAGFTGNTVCFSKSYLPYAWPTDYQMTTEHNVVSRIAVGNSVAVLTEGYPYIFSGVTPESMAGQKIESNQACVSKRSAVVASGMVIYASPDGLVAISNSSAEVITDRIITKEQWQSFQPSTIEAYLQEGRYLAFYGAALDKCFIFDPTNGDFRTFDATAYCGFNDLLTDSLYLSQGGFVNKWEASPGYMSFTWRSKEYRLSDQSMSHVHVDGDDLDSVGIRVFCDKVEISHKTPGQLNSLSFRLPSNRGDSWEFELYGTGTVKSVIITDSANDIKRLLNEA